jgi:hypothetical protein
VDWAAQRPGAPHCRKEAPLACFCGREENLLAFPVRGPPWLRGSLAKTGEHLNDSYLHRIRGEILLKRDSATATAEEASLTAIVVAREQKARSFELRAALSLAKLYQSTGRAADAHAVLAW